MQPDNHSSLLEPTISAFTIQEFNELYNQYGDVVLANILKLVKNLDDSEDILQRVFMSLWENRYRLHNRSIAGWLFVVSQNKAKSYLKQLAKFPFDPLDAADDCLDFSNDSMEQEKLYMEQLSMINEAFEALPKRKKEAFLLCRIQGKSKEEVAKDMRVTSNTISDYLKQANQAIRAYIKKNYPQSLIN